MHNDPRKLEQTINRRIANGFWYFMGIMTVHVMVKSAKGDKDDATYGTVILIALYFCYVFFQKFADASRHRDHRDHEGKRDDFGL